MRLFVAIHPPDDVVAALDALPRATTPGTRWTTRDQWHVTLRFLGEVADAAAVADRLGAVPLPAAHVVLGPRAAMLGRNVVQLPVAGLDALAAAVRDATEGAGAPDPHPRFKGHLTLARTKGRIDLRGLELAGAWDVAEVALVRSHLGRGGARYETLARWGLRGL